MHRLAILSALIILAACELVDESLTPPAASGVLLLGAPVPLDDGAPDVVEGTIARRGEHGTWFQLEDGLRVVLEHPPGNQLALPAEALGRTVRLVGRLDVSTRPPLLRAHGLCAEL